MGESRHERENIMNANLRNKIELGAGGRIFVSLARDNQVSLVCLGEYDEVRHMYNQMACLIGGAAVQSLRGMPAAPGTVMRSTTLPPHSWIDTFSGDAPVHSEHALFELASQGPSAGADKVGYLAFHNYWPQDMWRLPGVPHMRKCLSESLGRVFYDFLNYPAVRVGGTAETSVMRRVKEGIVAAKRLGYVPYNEPALMQFMETLVAARFLQFIHEVVSH